MSGQVEPLNPKEVLIPHPDVKLCVVVGWTAEPIQIGAVVVTSNREPRHEQRAVAASEVLTPFFGDRVTGFIDRTLMCHPVPSPTDADPTRCVLPGVRSRESVTVVFGFRMNPDPTSPLRWSPVQCAILRGDDGVTQTRIALTQQNLRVEQVTGNIDGAFRMRRPRRVVDASGSVRQGDDGGTFLEFFAHESPDRWSDPPKVKASDPVDIPTCAQCGGPIGFGTDFLFAMGGAVLCVGCTRDD